MSPAGILGLVSTALVPILSGLVGFIALRAVQRKTITVPVFFALFSGAVLVGMCLGFIVVMAFSHYLHGESDAYVIFAPIGGAIFAVPVALLFAIVLAIIKSRPNN